MSFDDEDDLVGGGPPKPFVSKADALKQATRPAKAAKAAPPAEEPEEEFHVDAAQLLARGVTPHWLATALGHDRKYVTKKMAQLIPLGNERGNVKRYNFQQAVQVLVKPNVDLAEYIKTVQPKDLPLQLQKEYWSALRARQDYQLRAGELWRTDDVLEVLGETFKTMKHEIQLWVDTLERVTDFTDDQRKKLVDMSDALQDGMYQSLIRMPAKHKTLSTASEESEAPNGV